MQQEAHVTQCLITKLGKQQKEHRLCCCCRSNEQLLFTAIFSLYLYVMKPLFTSYHAELLKSLTTHSTLFFEHSGLKERGHQGSKNREYLKMLPQLLAQLFLTVRVISHGPISLKIVVVVVVVVVVVLGDTLLKFQYIGKIHKILE